MVDLVPLHRDNDEERAARLERLMEEFRAKSEAPRGTTGPVKPRALPAKATGAGRRANRLRKKTGN